MYITLISLTSMPNLKHKKRKEAALPAASFPNKIIVIDSLALLHRCPGLLQVHWSWNSTHRQNTEIARDI